MHQLRLFAIGLAFTALVSCGGADLVLPGDGEPAAIAIVQGNGQSGRVGEVLAEPLIVEVLDGSSRPVRAATVVVELSGALAEPDTVSTDNQGRASVAIILGSQIGEAAGLARVIAPEGPAEVRASFAVVALAASANGLSSVSGDGQIGPAGTALAAPLVVEVTDVFGNPIEGVAITWTPQGGGSVSQPVTTTAGDGRTSIIRTLGPTSGLQSTLATSEGLAGSPVTFNHTVTAGNASGVLIVGGNNQTAAPRATLPLELGVQVVDADGNPVVAAPITWVVTAGGGTVAPATGATDGDGRAATTWTLGASVGANTTLAIVSGVGQAGFTATAVAGSPSRIRVVSGDDQTGQAGTRLAAGLVAQVLDADDNPVANVPVSWTSVSGGGSVSPASAPTGADGQASTAWTLGPSLGSQRVDASTPGAGSVQFDATATAGAPSGLGLVTQPSDVAQAGVPFLRQPVVQVLDASGNPVQVSGVTVTAAIASGAGRLSGTATARTGSDGRATFTNLGIGGATGAHSLIFAAGGFTSVTSSGIDVQPAGTSTRITSDAPDPSEPGENVAVIFQVTSLGGIPSGTVLVTASGGSETCSATVSAGGCTLALTGVGDRTLTASYQGSGLFTPSSGTAPHRVQAPSPIATTTQITSDAPDPSEPGVNVEVVFQVTSSSGAPPGDVQVTASGGAETCTAPVSTGRCTLALTVEGDRTLTASYQGSGLFTPSSGTAPHRVQAPSPIGTTTEITSDAPDPSEPGVNVEVVFQVTSSSGPPPGDVQVTASGGTETCTAPVSTGRCTLALTVEGDRTLTASYQGSGLFTPSSGSAPHRVEAPSPIATTTQITSDEPDPSEPGAGVEVVFQVTSSSGLPPGDVVVTASGGSETCSAPVSTGRCTLALTVEGTRTLTASYQGAGLFTPSSGNTDHSVVTPDTPPTAGDDAYSATAGVELSVPAPGVLANDVDPDDSMTAMLLTPATNGTVTLNDDGSFAYTSDGAFSGEASFTYRVNAGSGSADATVRIDVTPPGP